MPWTTATTGFSVRRFSANGSIASAGRLDGSRGRPEELGHVEARGGVFARGAQHRHPLLVVAVERGQRVAERDHHLGHERILLANVVDDDLQHAAVDLGSDLR